MQKHSDLGDATTDPRSGFDNASSSHICPGHCNSGHSESAHCHSGHSHLGHVRSDSSRLIENEPSCSQTGHSHFGHNCSVQFPTDQNLSVNSTPSHNHSGHAYSGHVHSSRTKSTHCHAGHAHADSDDYEEHGHGHGHGHTHCSQNPFRCPGQGNPHHNEIDTYTESGSQGFENGDCCSGHHCGSEHHGHPNQHGHLHQHAGHSHGLNIHDWQGCDCCSENCGEDSDGLTCLESGMAMSDAKTAPRVLLAPSKAPERDWAPERVCMACCGHSGRDHCKASGQGCVPHEMVKTRVSIRNICCEAEVRLISRIVEPMTGVESVVTNPFSKVTVITHCPVECCASPDFIISKLNEANLGASLLGQNSNDKPEKQTCLETIKQNVVLVILVPVSLLMLLGYIVNTQQSLERWFQLAAVLLGLPYIIQRVFVALRRCIIDISVLVIIAVSGSWFLGDFKDAAAVVFLFMLAEVMEAKAMNYVTRSLTAVMQLQETRSVLRVLDGKQVAVSDLKPGDLVALRPGEECPSDGVVRKGAACCSEAALTGEAFPIQKLNGSEVVAGTVVLNGYMEVEVTQTNDNTSLAKIQERVEEAQMQKSASLTLIETFARWWMPVVLTVVFVVAAVLPLATDHNFRKWLHRALVVLLTSCPCALIIGAPLPTICAIASAARKGVLIKSAEVVERLPRVKSIGLDKTGTVTKGEFHVLAMSNLSSTPSLSTEEQRCEADILKLAAALEAKSAHPMAAAIVSKAVGCAADAYEGGGLPKVKKFQMMEGVGLLGEVLDYTGAYVQIVVGNAKVFDVCGVSSEDGRANFAAFQQEHPDDTCIAVILGGRLQMGIALNDAIRPGAKVTVEKLQNLGCDVALLTGDTYQAGKPVVETLGLEMTACSFSMLPAGKHAWVVAQEKSGRPTVMVGDGINDASALAAATVGVAMGENSTVLAAKSADVVMMTEDFSRLPQCMELCRYSRRIMLVNIGLPAVTKIAAVVLALMGRLEVWMAMAADLGTLLVVLLLGITVLAPQFWR